MPQLDTSTFSGQIFWLLIAFLLLFAVVRTVAAPRLMGMAARRAKQQDDDLAAAEAARATEKAREAEHTAAIEAAHAKAQAELAAANDAARVQAAAKLAELGARLKAQSDEAERALVSSRENAERDLQVVADDVAGDLVRRLTGTPA
jgi:F-type H+-transporting ATPase subunit b